MAYPGFDLTGKVALVTGGNSGIGLGMAEAMAQAGAAVCIWGTNEDKNAAALARLKGHGPKAMALRCDVSDEAAVERCFAETVGGAAMIRSMAVELARHQIRANTIVPGWIDTPMTAGHLHGEAFTEKVLPRVPMRRWGVGSDFGGIAVYLASAASSYHTGDTF